MDRIKAYMKSKYFLFAIITFGAIALGLAGIIIIRSGNEVIIEAGEQTSASALRSGTGEHKQTEQSIIVEGLTNESTIKEYNNSTEVDKNQIKVYVVGCVNSPGLVTLRKGQLIGDAIDAAGGVTAEADIYNINLAYKLNDNAMIKVKSKNESGQINGAPREAGISTDIIYDSGSGAVTSTGEGSQISSPGSQKGQRININTAGIEQLDTLPGIGAETAKDIIEYRDKNGSFKTIEDIMNITGIKESKFAKIKDSICVE